MTTDNDKIFDRNKLYFLEIKAAPDRQVIHFHNARVTMETENFFMFIDSYTDREVGYAKCSIVSYRVEG